MRTHPRLWLRLWAWPLGALLAGCIVFGNAVAEQSPEPAQDCEAAALLVQEAHPQRALRLIAAAEEQQPGAVLCPDERLAAEQAVAKAQAAAAAAASLAEARAWAAARTAAEAALAVDAENTSARQTRYQAAGLAATWQARWADATERYLDPLEAVLVPFLVTVLILLTLARLVVVLLPIRWPERTGRWRTWLMPMALAFTVLAALLLVLGWPAPLTLSTPALVVGVLVLGLAAVLFLLADEPSDRRRWPPAPALLAVTGMLGLLLLPLLPTGWAGDGSSRPPTQIRAAMVGIAGLTAVDLMAWWMATRRRLQVRVSEKGVDQPAQLGHVIALLHELGAEPPRGLEVPRGADVTALEGAFATIPDNAITKFVKGLVGSIAGVTPWSANLEYQDRDLLSVEVTRNGRCVTSATITPKVLLPAGDADSAAGVAVTALDLDKAAAALILSTIAREYDDIRRSLTGSVDWRGLALHCIATTDLSEEDDKERIQRRAVLAQAVAFDPTNLAAQLAFQHAMHRQETEVGPLRTYRDWLERFADTQLQGDDAATRLLQLRARYTSVVVAANTCFASGAPDHRDDLARARRAMSALEPLVSATANWPEAHTALGVQMKQALEAVRMFPGPGPEGSAEKPPAECLTSPVGAYNWAAYYGSLKERALLTSGQPPTGAEVDRADRDAVEILRWATQLPRVKRWLVRDPQLSGFTQRFRYHEEFLNRPRTDFCEVTVVAPHAAALRAAGFGTVESLAGLHSSGSGLFAVIPKDRQLRETIVLLAGLALDLKEASALHPAAGGLGRWRIEILEHLIARELTTRKALDVATASAVDIEGLGEEIASSMWAACRPAATTPEAFELERSALPKSLSAWLARHPWNVT